MSSYTTRYSAILILFISLLMFATTTSAQIYYTSDDSLWFMPSNEEEAVLISDDRAEAVAVDTAAEYIFWITTFPSDEVKRANLDGSDVQVISDNQYLRGLDFDPENETLFFMDDDNLTRTSYDGSNAEILIEGEEGGVTDGSLALDVDLENEKIYWVKRGAVMRADLNGENVETLVEFAAYIQPTGIVVDPEGGFVYWSNTSDDYIRRAEFGSWEPEDVIQAESPAGLALDAEAGKIYWVNDYYMSGDGGDIYRSNLDGSDSEMLMETGFTRGALFVLPNFQIPTSNERPGNVLPNAVRLQSNYPNPFNPHTTISYSLPEAMPVTLQVYNFLGQKVQSLLHGSTQPAGNHKVVFDATNLPSGTYFYRLETAAGSFTRKMTLIK